MKEIKANGHVDIYPDIHDEMPGDEFEEMKKRWSYSKKITVFSDGTIHILGVSMPADRARRWHFALGRAIELAGGW